MKNLLIVLIAVVATLCGGQAVAADPLAAFEALVAKASAETRAATPVAMNERTGKWLKRSFELDKVAYDVRKTDSLVSPVIGVVTMNLIAHAAAMATEAEAQAAQAQPGRLSYVYAITLRYAWRGEAWVLSNGDYEVPDLKGRKFELTAEKIKAEPGSPTSSALVYWVP